MPEWSVILLTLVAIGLVLFARADVVLATILGIAVVIPTPLDVPHAHFTFFSVQHVVAIVLAGRLVRMAVERRPSTRFGRPNSALVAWIVIFAVSLLVGYVFTVSSAYVYGGGQRLGNLACQVVFFLGCLVLVREMGSPWRALGIAGGVLSVSLGIAFIEHFTSDSWGHWIFSRLPDQIHTDAAHPLTIRNGQTRVRAGSEFALEFAWVSVCLLPAFAAWAARTRAGAYGVFAVAAAAALAVYWSDSRSALAGVAVTLVLLALLSKDARISGPVLLFLLGGLVAYGLSESVSQHLVVSSDDVSVAARFHRLGPILGELAKHPFRGLGLGNLSASGFHTTDNALLLQYVEVGMVGVVALVLLFLTLLAQTLRSTLVARPDERAAAAACFAGVVAYVAAAQSFDAFTLIQAPQVVWFLVAVATVVAERAGRPVEVRRMRWRPVVATAVVGVGIGAAVLSLVPTRASSEYVVTTMTARADLATFDTNYLGTVYVDTMCAIAETAAETMHDVSVDCRQVDESIGVATMHIDAPNRAALGAATVGIFATLHTRAGYAGLHWFPEYENSTGRASIWVTAPAWVPLLALGLLLHVPWPFPRRRRPDPGRVPLRARVAV